MVFLTDGYQYWPFDKVLTTVIIINPPFILNWLSTLVTTHHYDADKTLIIPWGHIIYYPPTVLMRRTIFPNDFVSSLGFIMIANDENGR
jgi:hypothetical protein